MPIDVRPYARRCGRTRDTVTLQGSGAEVESSCTSRLEPKIYLPCVHSLGGVFTRKKIKRSQLRASGFPKAIKHKHVPAHPESGLARQPRLTAT
jgi:hypothetical protein